MSVSDPAQGAGCVPAENGTHARAIGDVLDRHVGPAFGEQGPRCGQDLVAVGASVGAQPLRHKDQLNQGND
jgi:hypothetical protein